MVIAVFADQTANLDIYVEVENAFILAEKFLHQFPFFYVEYPIGKM